ncbi:MAG: flagellar hook-associated protein FlgL, partial [Terriglobales bacterium]
MFERITDSLMTNNLLQALNQTEQGQNQALTQVETGRSVNTPSDNPVAASLAAVNQSQAAQVTQFLQNINSVTGALQVGDSALSSAVNLLNQAVSLGTEGANGGLSSSQLAAISQQVGQIQQQMVDVANTTFNGVSIFAGTAGGPAYTADAAQSDGVQYQGNSGVNQVQIAPGASVAVNVPGSQIFQNASGSIFQALHDLQSSLTAGSSSGVQSALGELNNSVTTLGEQRVFYGATTSRLSSTTTFLNNEQLDLTQEQNSLVGANLANSITQLSSAETARQAILTAGAQ